MSPDGSGPESASAGGSDSSLGSSDVRAAREAYVSSTRPMARSEVQDKMLETDPWLVQDPWMKESRTVLVVGNQQENWSVASDADHEVRSERSSRPGLVVKLLGRLSGI